MYQSVSSWDFKDAFKQAGRENQFSQAGLDALFNYLEEYEEETGEQIELDVIAICCDFTEYENLAELQIDYPDVEDLEDLQNQTTVIMIDDDGFIIEAYQRYIKQADLQC